MINLNINKYYKLIKRFYNFFISKEIFIIFSLVIFKVIFQIILLKSGFLWLSSDDYCRTVKSIEWLEKPIIYAGVWLSPHFWVNGIVMIFIKDLFTAATTTNMIFSSGAMIYFYLICKTISGRRIAVISTVIFIFFPFQAWMGISGLPESIHFFFILAGIYYSLKYKDEEYSLKYLILASGMFFFGNMFRYEGWLFTIVFFIYIYYLSFSLKKGNNKYIQVVIAFFAFFSIMWWLLQNYINYDDFLYFAKETNKIYEDYGGIKVLQKVVQYPIFIFYIAPATTFFALLIVYKFLKNLFTKKNDITLLNIFIFFNLAELILLMLQGLFGTGGTNMISRYIVINGLLFIPLAVIQIFKFRRWLTVIIFILIITGNVIWSFYYPHPFREDTYAVGNLIRYRVESDYFKKNDKVYFEELEGYYDIYAVQTMSNYPSKFILGNLPSTIIKEKQKSTNRELSPEELNLLDIKSFLEKNNIAMAVVKSDSYLDKLRKFDFRNEEIGDYKIFYMRDLESNLNDSNITLFTKNVLPLKNNPDLINFNKTIALKEFRVDNSNFGFNPQTVSLTFTSVNKNIIDSIDYDNLDFERYKSIIEIRRQTDDSLVYSDSKKMFSDRNIEDLIVKNEFTNIIVIKPFALIYYSKKYSNSPFESGMYNLGLRLYDSKNKTSLSIYKGDSLYFPASTVPDTTSGKLADSLKLAVKSPVKPKYYSSKTFQLASIIAFFPDTKLNSALSKENEFYKIITENGLRVFFSQRYQADHFLNYVFTYF